jgi:ribA/ribD-fused uncharacterized protein
MISDTAQLPHDPGLRSYRRTECVVFHKTREAFGGLSNMAAGYPLRVNDIDVPTSEALYQACRFPHLPKIQDLIICQTSPMTAKMKSKPHRARSREDWDFVRVAIMKWCLKVKLVQHWTAFGELLLSTSDKPIVEHSRKDRFWGAVPEREGETLSGSNVLGRLLMELRQRLRNDPAVLETVEPVPILDFLFLGQPIEPIHHQPVTAFTQDLIADDDIERQQHIYVTRG